MKKILISIRKIVEGGDEEEGKGEKESEKGELPETGSYQTQKIERDDGGVFKGCSRINI
jgi:hypothetical protein